MAKAKTKTKTKSKKKPPKKKAPAHEGYHLPVRTESEQLESLPEELQDAWRALRSFLGKLGAEPSHTSHRSIMFYGRRCYAFVRPKKKYLELNFFLNRAIDSELLKKVEAVSKTRWVHVVTIVHAEQIEEPLTDWLREARLQAMG